MQSSITQANQSETSEEKGAFYWGWIPQLRSNSNPVPLEPELFHSFNPFYSIDRRTISSEGCSVVLKKTMADETRDRKVVDVHVEDGLIRFSSEGIGLYLADSIYQSVKSVYHVDQTHGKSQGLHCVNADTKQEAVDLIAYEFISRIVPESDRRLDENPESTWDYMFRKGLVEYGAMFLKRYGNEMSESRSTSLSELIIANRRFNSDRLDHQNMEVSLKLSEKVRYLTVLVLCLTWFTAVITLMGYLLSSGYISGDFHTVLLLMAATVPSIIWLWIPFVEERMKSMSRLKQFLVMFVHGTIWVAVVNILFRLSGIDPGIGYWKYLLFATAVAVLPLLTYLVYLKNQVSRFNRKIKELAQLERDMMKWE